MKTGIELIADERQEQLSKWSLEHDSTHQYGELAKLAAVLCCSGTDAIIADPTGFIEHGRDAWGITGKHAEDRIKQLQIAGASIAAEIDRLQAHSPTHKIEA